LRSDDVKAILVVDDEGKAILDMIAEAAGLL